MVSIISIILTALSLTILATDVGGNVTGRRASAERGPLVDIVPATLRADRKNPTLPEMAPPKGVRLSLATRRDAMTITWDTPIALVSPPYVEYGRSAERLHQNQSGTTTVWEYANLTHYTHTVTLVDLHDDSKYYYQVGSLEQGWSHVFHFRTFPRGDSFPLRICVFGDLGSYNGTSTPYLQKAVQRRDFDLVIHVGDIGYDLHSDGGTRGDRFLEQIEPITAYVPYMVVAGNHEDDDRNFTNYASRFRMPNSPLGDSQFYSIDVGLVHMLAVSTEYHGFFYKYGINTIYAQDEWLREDIKKANANRKRVPWVLAYQHRPFYCSNENSYECQAFENQLIQHGYEDLPGLEQTLAEAVDIGFWGHEHSYERLWPVVGRKVYNLTANPYHNAPAPAYIITGSAGCYSGHAWFPNEQLSLQPASVVRLNDYGYSIVHVHNATHVHVEQISVERGGQVIDSVWVTKDLGHRPSSALTALADAMPLPTYECREPPLPLPRLISADDEDYETSHRQWDKFMYSCHKIDRKA